MHLLDFHIMNIPFMSSNIPSAPAYSYGVYASQFIRYASCCSNYSDFLLCNRAPGFLKLKWIQKLSESEAPKTLLTTHLKDLNTRCPLSW